MMNRVWKSSLTLINWDTRANITNNVHIFTLLLEFTTFVIYINQLDKQMIKNSQFLLWYFSPLFSFFKEVYFICLCICASVFVCASVSVCLCLCMWGYMHQCECLCCVCVSVLVECLCLCLYECTYLYLCECLCCVYGCVHLCQCVCAVGVSVPDSLIYHTPPAPLRQDLSLELGLVFSQLSWNNWRASNHIVSVPLGLRLAFEW